jgi:hypothetical protein
MLGNKGDEKKWLNIMDILLKKKISFVDTFAAYLQHSLNFGLSLGMAFYIPPLISNSNIPRFIC